MPNESKKNPNERKDQQQRPGKQDRTPQQQQGQPERMPQSQPGGGKSQQPGQQERMPQSQQGGTGGQNQSIEGDRSRQGRSDQDLDEGRNDNREPGQKGFDRDR